MIFRLDESIIKIDGVQTAADAHAFEGAGAVVIGIDPAPRAALSGPVNRRTALEIREALTQSKLAVRLDEAAGSVDAALADARVLSPDMLQVTHNVLGWNSWREALAAEGLPVFVDAPMVSYDDDAAFIESRMGGLREWPGAIAQVRFLANIANPWSFLRDKAPSRPDGYTQTEDLQTLTQTYPMLISMDVSPGEVHEFCQMFPDAKGLFFDIATGDRDSVLKLIEGAKAVTGIY